MAELTLIDILQERKEAEHSGITFIESSSSENFLSYKQLHRQAMKALYALQQAGLKPRNELVLQVDDNRSFIVVFWGCILGGIIPVPLSTGRTTDHKKKVFNVWTSLNNPFLISDADQLARLGEYASAEGLNEMYADMAGKTIDLAGMLKSDPEGIIHDANENEIALVQFSSGSTGSPKGVVLTHKNIITNLKAISAAASYGAGDSLLSWMPLTHDMGLIGFHLNPLFVGLNHYIIPVNVFIRRPALWFDVATTHQATILCSPNFGFEYILKHCNGKEKYNWDLSKVRIVFNGAEPISLQTCNRFASHLAGYGLNARSIRPVYGLAEASLAVTISDIGANIVSVSANRSQLSRGQKIAAPTDPDHSVTFVNVGRPVQCCQVRITDENNNFQEEETIGYVQVKGESVTAGYYNNESETNAVLDNEWLNTGDLGFLKGSELYITGRAKDIFFVNGRNYYPHDIEHEATAVDGIELNKIVVSGYYNDQKRKDEVIAFIFHRGKIETFIPVAISLKTFIADRLGIEIDRVIPVNDIPRTTSGKLQRFQLLQQLQEGYFTDIEQAVSKVAKEYTQTLVVEQLSGNDTEMKLLQLVKNVLRTEHIGIEDNYLLAGGSSLQVAELAMTISKEFEVELAPELVYKSQTVNRLAEALLQLNYHAYIPLPSAPVAAYYPLSYAQKMIFYATELNSRSTAYNVPVAVKIEGNCQRDVLEASIRKLVARHDALRMTFHQLPEPVFKLTDHSPFELISILCDKQQIDDILKQCVQPFDLAEGPLFRIKLLEISHLEYILFLDFHHLVTDGVSVTGFIAELMDIYNGTVPEWPPVQYKDYSAWEKESLSSPKAAGEKEYWIRQLQGEWPVLEMPTDFPRPLIFNAKGEKIPFTIGAETSRQLKELAAGSGSNLHVLLLSIYKILLSKYTGQKDIVTGIPVSGRTHPDLLNMQGMFVNNLPIRSSIDDEENFLQWLQREKAQVQAALNNSRFPFYELLQLGNNKRNVGRNPLFDTMFIYQDMQFPVSKSSGLVMSKYFFDPGFSKYDISLEVFEEGDGIQCAFEYSTSIFKRSTIKRFIEHFNNLLCRVIEDPAKRIAELSVISDAEYDSLVWKCNESAQSYPTDMTIYALFEEQVKKTPDNIAVEYKNTQLTYRQLGDKVDRLAAELRRQGVLPDSITGIYLERSPELIISMLAVLKAGGGYLPVDIDLPHERLQYLVSDSRCNIMLTHTAGKFPAAELLADKDNKLTSVLYVDFELDCKSKPAHLPHVNTPDDLAYMIYTSGTTGLPKGVMIAHRSLTNYVCWAVDSYLQRRPATFALFTSVSFDLTVTSVFCPLISGNSIIIYGGENNEILIEKVIADNKADTLKLTPSHLKVMAGSQFQPPAATIKRLIVGGEQLEDSLAEAICKKFGADIEIYNEYGPTEATVGCMIYRRQPGAEWQHVPIGEPAANTQIYLLDENLSPVPAGVPGEIYISGDCLAKGYWNHEKLTRQRFIQNVFLPAQKMYKTGDLAKRLTDGTLMYIGRADQQVKINGYRIELSEVEVTLKKFGNISDAVVVVKTSRKNSLYLCAYYKCKTTGEKVNETSLRKFLSEKLPYYMIPGSFVQMQQIPLTLSGKIDHAALPEPSLYAQESKQSESTGYVEAAMLQVWREVLADNSISTVNNFFELGGDSIKAVQIASRLHEKNIKVAVKDILTYHTIDQVSRFSTLDGNNTQYEQGIIAGEKALSPIESWFFDQQFANPHFYNQSVLLKLNKKADLQLLQKAFAVLIDHHDSLRINYDPVKNVLFYNETFDGADFWLETIGAGRMVELKSSLDITKSLLIKAALVKSKTDGDSLFVTAHHLIIDGISWRILLHDLYRVYDALEKNVKVQLPPKTAALTDCQLQLSDAGLLERVHRETAYWNEIEKSEFSIPCDFITSDWRVLNQHTIRGSLDREETGVLLKEAYRTYNTDVPVLLNTAVALTLNAWTGSSECIIEQESHGRSMYNLDLSRTLGWFTAMYPVKLNLTKTLLTDHVSTVKEQMESIPDEGLGYGMAKFITGLLQAGKKKMTAVRLNYLGQFDKEFDNDLFTFSTAPTGPETDPENSITAMLVLDAMVTGGQFVLDISYNTKAHAAPTMRWLIDRFFENLRRILAQIKSDEPALLPPSGFNGIQFDDEELKALFN